MNLKPDNIQFNHLNLGNIKLAISASCREMSIFKGAYFHACALYMLQDGRIEITIGNEEHNIKQSEFILIRQHAKLDFKKFYEEAESGSIKSFIFYFFPDFIKDFLEENTSESDQIIHPDQKVIPLNSSKELSTFVESMQLYLNHNQTYNRGTLQQKTIECLKALTKTHPELIEFLKQNLRPVKIDLFEFMINSYINDLSIPELAQLTGRSLSAFKRDFKEIFNESPHQWILKRKMDFAEEMIRCSNFSPVSLFILLGFKELSHFSNVFKKIKGYNLSQISLQA
ncbi:AraC family transcriptional regulator [Ancylomarina sp. DW003]|nr:AraC family transcriptional regulator [Ancylomarina sp. DW003]MDE5421981.1 AraC family transcriptional regulator [Ancylomarina sp. DW003]